MKRTLPALLTGTAVLIVLVGAPTPATARPPAPAAVAGSGLVRGIPHTPYERRQRETPDQALPPVIPKEHGPKGHTPEGPMPRRPAEPQRRVEYVPRAEAAYGHRPVWCSRSAGPYQRQAEAYLRRRVDGRQSREDCQAIRRFQQAQHIAPATGFAGPVTGAVMRLLAAQQDPNRDGRCPNRPERVACVDLSRQIMWVQQGGKVIFRPVAIRSGQRTMETRPGTYRIYYRHRNHTSSIYRTPMPFAQFFDRGQALHGVYGDLYAPPGSHGCVNLRWTDAEKLWKVLRKQDIVHIWGRKTGV